MTNQTTKPENELVNEIDNIGISVMKTTTQSIFQSIKTKIKTILSGKSNKQNA